MNFNTHYQRYKEMLPSYVLKKIGEQIIKKYNINEANAAIDDIFLKYKQQYEKKQEYDIQYFQQNTKVLQSKLTELKKKYNILKQQNAQYIQYIKNHQSQLSR